MSVGGKYETYLSNLEEAKETYDKAKSYVDSSIAMYKMILDNPDIGIRLFNIKPEKMSVDNTKKTIDKLIDNLKKGDVALEDGLMEYLRLCCSLNK